MLGEIHMPNEIDKRFKLLNGKVSFYSIPVDESDESGVDRILLTEDLMIVSYPNNVVLDLGWYGDSSNGEGGYFCIYLIKNGDWGKPLMRIPCQTLQKAIDLMNRIAVLIPDIDKEISQFNNIDHTFCSP
jgi:hypothetical protein